MDTFEYGVCVCVCVWIRLCVRSSNPNPPPPQVCGSPDIPLHLLKSVATYKGVEPTAPLIQWFWEVMESFSNTERSLFLRFVWGRTRLPRTIADFRGRDFVVQVRGGDTQASISVCA